MRRRVTLGMVVVGFLLQGISYLLLAARIGSPTSPAVSNPRLQFAPLIFIVGVMLVFVAAIVYEVMSNRSDDR